MKKQKIIYTSLITLFLFFVILVSVNMLFKNVSASDSWYDPTWLYRRGIEIHNDLVVNLTDEEVLVEMDTSLLISAGKMQDDCDDLRFIDSDDSTQLEYWVEGGCNTSATQVWVRIPSLPDVGKTVYAYYGNDGALNSEELWSGNFMMYTDSVCPLGWTSASSLNGNFLSGSVTYGTTGGASAHSHSDVISDTSTISTTNASGTITGSLTGTTTAHTHDTLKSLVNENSLVFPPYLDMVLCYKDEFLLSAGLISMFDTSAPSGWTRFTALDDKLPRANATYGTTGGSDTHTHTTTTGYTTSVPTGTQSSFVPFNATGGTVTTSGGYTIHTFPGDGTFTPSTTGDVEVLVVAGGGGGGYATTQTSGGGGGGGLCYQAVRSVTAGDKTVTVGNGGNVRENGYNSVFDTITAIGGGRGGSYGVSNPTTGGSGGGGQQNAGGAATTQGNSGGATCYGFAGGNGNVNSPGGGGGAGSVGANGSGGGAAAGSGRIYSISGSSVTYSNGGIGGEGSGASGAANTGRGGAGGRTAGSGGSGIVIISYLTPAALSGTYASSTHTHTSNSATVDSISNLPPYLKMVFAKADYSTIGNQNYILITSELPPMGWNRYTELDDKFPIGSSTYGDTGGSLSHTHDVDVSTAGPSATINGYGSGTSFADATHTHSYSTTTSSVSNLPPYISVIYSQRKSSQIVSIQEESPYNTAPTIPTDLYTQGETTPSPFSALNPEFSAIFNDPDIDDVSGYYEVEVNTASDFTGTVMWDSGKVSMTPTNQGNRSPSITYVGDSLAGDGITYYWRIKFWDSKDVESIWSSPAQFTIDSVIPTGTVSINSGVTYTTTTSVTLDLSATDTTSGVYEMMICNNSSFTGCTWEAYSTSKAWTLTTGDGTKTIYVKYIDNATNESTSYNDTIILDSVVPTGTVSINSGVTYTTTTSVTLDLSATDTTSGVYEMMICNNSSFTGCTWEAYSTSKAWTLTTGDGTKTIYVKYIDNATNESTSYNDTIILDSVVPTGTVSINSGVTYTTTTSVTLDLSATDTTSGVYEMMICNNSLFTGCTWEAYSTSKAWTLTTGDGTKTIYVKYIDNVGLISSVVNDTILFSTPVVSQVTPTVIPEIPKQEVIDEIPKEEEITLEEIIQVKAILLGAEEPGEEINQQVGVTITVGESEIDTKGKEVVHVYRGSEIDISIPVSTLTRKDSNIDKVYAVLGESVIRLIYNTIEEKYIGKLTSGNTTGKQNIDILTMFKDNSTSKFVLGILIDPYGYVYILGKDSNQLRIKGATVNLYKVEDKGRTLYIVSGQDNPQITNQEGEYSFIVEPGTYVLVVKADGYKEYDSGEFEVQNTTIEKNIEIEESFSIFDYWLYMVIGFIILLGVPVLIKTRRKV